MNILITGASGLVGTAVAERLQKLGHHLVAIGRTKPKSKLKVDFLAASLDEPQLSAKLITKFSRCEVIIHIGANLETDLSDASVSAVNCFGTHQMIALAKHWHVKQFIYISSIYVIGSPQQLPITEQHPIGPTSAYHASKLYSEELVRLLSQELSISGISLRLSSPVGPAMPRDKIFSIFVNRAQQNLPLLINGQGTRRQNYVDVRDIAQAVTNCLPVTDSGVFNIAGKHSISNLELAELCIKSLNSKSKIKFTGHPDHTDDIDWQISITKAQKILNFQPVISLDKSVKSFIK